MKASFSVQADRPRTVTVWSDLAHGTTIWVDGQVAVEDPSWRLAATHAIPTPAGAVTVALSGGWPLPRRAAVHLGGVAAKRIGAPSAGMAPRRPIPWWGRIFSAIALLSILSGLLVAPFAVLGSFGALRASRGGQGAGDGIVPALGFASFPWVMATAFSVLLGQGDVVQALKDGGLLMIPIAFLGFGAIAFGAAHALQAHRLSALRALVAAALVAALGAWVTWRSGAQLEEALQYASPEMVELIRADAAPGAALPRQLGGALAGMALAIAAVGEVRRLRPGAAR